jgi:hypothetical protein
MSTISEALHAFVSRYLDNVHTCIPARFVSYDHNKSKSTVKPQMAKRYGENKLEYPQITDVPVLFPRSSNFSFTFPIKKNDPCLLIMSEKSIDDWMDNGKINIPLHDNENYSLSNAIAIPGIYPYNELEPPDNNNDVLLKFGNSEIRIKSNEINIKSDKIAFGGTQELLDLFDQTLDALIASVVPTSIGAQQLSKVTDTTISQIKSKLGQIKGGL